MFNFITEARKVTHWIAGVSVFFVGWAVSDQGQAVIGGIVKAYPKLSGLATGVGILAALYFSPKKKVAVMLALCLGLAMVTWAQEPAPVPLPDVPVTHVSISASFNGYDSKGKFVPANIDTFGVAVYRNTAATRGFDVNYEHISVPSLGQRWEMGLGCYWLSLPKIKNLLFDTSNFVATACAGAGKLLSTSDGNRFAWTVAPSVTYPIAGHMGWTVSYQYLKATGGIAGVANKSYSQVGTGPQIHF